MKQTSLHAWYHKVQPTLKTRHEQILSIIEVCKEEGICMRAVAKVLDVSVHTISGRFSEMENRGSIKVKKDENGKDCVIFFGPDSLQGKQPHNLYVPA